jgi:hypothetical protein
VPDHSTFSKNRHGRFRDSDLLRQVFDRGRALHAEGLVGGEGFAVDASLITADAHRQRGVARADELDPIKPSGQRVFSGSGRCGLRRSDTGAAEAGLAD